MQREGGEDEMDDGEISEIDDPNYDMHDLQQQRTQLDVVPISRLNSDETQSQLDVPIQGSRLNSDETQSQLDSVKISPCCLAVNAHSKSFSVMKDQYLEEEANQYVEVGIFVHITRMRALS